MALYLFSQTNKTDFNLKQKSVGGNTGLIIVVL